MSDVKPSIAMVVAPSRYALRTEAPAAKALPRKAAAGLRSPTLSLWVSVWRKIEPVCGRASLRARSLERSCRG